MVHEEWENRDIEFMKFNNKNSRENIPVHDEDDAYPSDNDWEESGGQTPNQQMHDNSPARSHNKYPSHSVPGYGKHL